MPQVRALSCLHGYGIDAFLLLTASACGDIVSIRFRQPKQHAGSFPHLPEIYRQAVPMLLHLTANRTTSTRSPTGPAHYRLDGRVVEPARLDTMINGLDALARQAGSYSDRPWPLPVTTAWHAVSTGTPAIVAARELWPHYVNRVRSWLTSGQHVPTEQLAAVLTAAHADLRTAISADQGACP